MISQQTLHDAIETARNTHRAVLGNNYETHGFVRKIMREAGEKTGKQTPIQSLSTHTLNTVFVGLSVYAYDTYVRQNTRVDDTKALRLICALAGHDANKYVAQDPDAPPLDTTVNSNEVLDYFFQTDPYGIKRILPGDTEDERELDLADIKWLIQRTETGDTSHQTTGQSSQRVRGLERYCRIADGFASIIHREGADEAVEWLNDFFADEKTQHVQVKQHTPLEQPVLNTVVSSAVRTAINGDRDNTYPSINTTAHGVILGSTPYTTVYLGNPVDDQTFKDTVTEIVRTTITKTNEFQAKTKWNSFDPLSLDEISIPFDTKREVIEDGYRDGVRNGSGGVPEFEHVDESFSQYLPELVWVTYQQDDTERIVEQYPTLHKIWKITYNEYGSQKRKAGFLAELHKGYTNQHTNINPKKVDNELAQLQNTYQPDLKDALTPDVDPIPDAVETYLTYNVITPTEIETSIDTSEMCFLCGEPADRKYKFGERNAFYGTNAFSRRLAPGTEYKKICPTCTLENELLMNKIRDVSGSFNNDVEFAFVYYSDFVAGVHYHTDFVQHPQDEGIIGGESDDGDTRPTSDSESPELSVEGFSQQYHIRPVVVGDQNDKLQNTKELLDTYVRYGAKVVIGTPFSSFEPTENVFEDHSSIRLQHLFGGDVIDDYQAVGRVRDFLDILHTAFYCGDGSTDSHNPYIQVRSDEYVEVTDYLVNNNALNCYTTDEQRVRELVAEYYNNHPTEGDKHMMMQTVAEEALDFYGPQYDSNHKKAKIFRTVIEATIDGFGRDKTGDELLEYVAGEAYVAAEREEYAGYVTPADAEAFVETVFQYLKEDGSFSDEELVSRMDKLRNTFLFAYEQALDGYNPDEQTTE